MKKYNTKFIITFVSITVVLVLLAVYFFRTYTPEGILWKNGISSKEVMLISKENYQFHHYLYEKNGEIKGIITLQKKGWNLWSLYNHAYQQKIESTDIEIIKASYPTYKDNHLEHIPVWGGVVILGDEDSFSIRIKNKEQVPNLTAKIDGKMYFFYSSPDLNDGDKIEVTKP
ncbi:hypothetical protein CHH67_12865 [Paenibacillus campinasensis]|uniref:Uncharacterized protein n=1 Tax=Paenibacillus campinasensis TaxID=66347 RepID=A0A268ESZ0_9BACL|nr:hypothetical protein CHH67_12865 [Paenibacillus campinasensis]